VNLRYSGLNLKSRKESLYLSSGETPKRQEAPRKGVCPYPHSGCVPKIKEETVDAGTEWALRGGGSGREGEERKGKGGGKRGGETALILGIHQERSRDVRLSRVGAYTAEARFQRRNREKEDADR